MVQRMLSYLKRAPHIGSVKAVKIILDSAIKLEEDQTLIDENVIAAVITAENCKIGDVSVYLEGDSAWNVWRASECEGVRDVELWNFFDLKGLHVLDEWSIPTLEVYSSIVYFYKVSPYYIYDRCDDVQLRSTNRAEEWQVIWGVTSSDYNAVTFNIRNGGWPEPVPFRGTRIYNTVKAQ
ncbi:hypothetical protein EVAR_45601_1 [Eumeta japonica]|uniref:Uncharacterized protein n=1 Tax=Eumeta variegata TaxID=151549 RepID=A0A4C1YZ85_EUMVA|nr:hypothetical protein EVAR_45601_1 [Eumeta japonica]